MDLVWGGSSLGVSSGPLSSGVCSRNLAWRQAWSHNPCLRAGTLSPSPVLSSDTTRPEKPEQSGSQPPQQASPAGLPSQPPGETAEPCPLNP